jgi:hypothetical protein
MSATAEWTIMVFLNAKNNLEPFAFPNFTQMASIGSTPQVQIVVEMGRPRYHYSDAHGAWSKTLRFHVENATQPTEAAAVADLGATNMGDARSLGDFVTWARDRYPAKRTMLVIWNHGQGWRRPAERAGERAPQPAMPSAVRYVSNDDDTGDKLYNRAIQDELTNRLRGERLDVIAFDACLMSMVETAYALRGVAKVMVGSEELEPGTGWDYTSWLQPLVDARGEIDAAGLGRLLVRGMESTYGDLEPTTLSATDLDQVESLAAAISRFATTATPRLAPSTVGTYRDARAECSKYAPAYNDLHSIDLGRFMEQIARGAFDEPVRAAARDVLAALKVAVIQNYASQSRRGKFGSHGLAIYFPISGRAHAADADGAAYGTGPVPFPVEFVAKEKWAGFLRRYCELVP